MGCAEERQLGVYEEERRVVELAVASVLAAWSHLEQMGCDFGDTWDLPRDEMAFSPVSELSDRRLLLRRAVEEFRQRRGARVGFGRESDVWDLLSQAIVAAMRV